MSSNAPTFDPLNATAEEDQDMMAGYLTAAGPGPIPDFSSAAFEHGWRMRRNDKAGVVDEDQRKLAGRMAENWRRANEIRQEAGERSARLRRGLSGPKRQA